MDVPPSPCNCAPSRTLRAGTRPPSQPCRVSERSEERRSGRGQHAGFARSLRAAPLVCRLPPGPQSRGWYGGGAGVHSGGQKQGQYMDLNHFLRRRQRRRRQRRQPAIARPTAICAPSPPGGPASGAHRSECGGRSDGRRSTCPRALGRGGLWRARERWRRWPRPAGRTPRSACRAPPPRGRAEPSRRWSVAVSGSTREEGQYLEGIVVCHRRE